MRRNLCLLSWILLTPPGIASADDQHYQSFVVGDEAMGMGGAYTAIAADPSGGWYNPAGIVDVRNTSLSLSANLYGIQDTQTGQTELIKPEDAISKLTVVPSAAGFVQALGRTDSNGQRPYAFGMTLVIPSYRRFTTSEEGTVSDPTYGSLSHGYTRTFNDETLWAGLLGAARLNWRLSVGCGLFLVHRSVSDQVYSFMAGNDQTGEYLSWRTAMTSLDFTNDSLVAVAGAKLRLSDRLFLGVMARSPSLTVFSTGRFRFARSRNLPGVSGFLPTPEELKVESESRINGELRAGVAYLIPDFLKLAADISLHLPVSYNLIQIDDPAARDALLIAPEVKREMVINGNLGAQFSFARHFSASLGLFTNFSSAPDISASQPRPGPASVDMYGGTLAIGFSSQHTLTRIGFMYSNGTGRDVHAVNSPEQLATDTQGFVRVNVTQTNMYFFLSSTFMY